MASLLAVAFTTRRHLASTERVLGDRGQPPVANALCDKTLPNGGHREAHVSAARGVAFDAFCHPEWQGEGTQLAGGPPRGATVSVVIFEI